MSPPDFSAHFNSVTAHFWLENEQKAASAGWDTGNNNYLPFLQYLLSIILKAYREFECRVEHVATAKLNKMERIRMMFEQKPGKIRKADIMAACPDISVSLIERTLKQMLDNGEIRKIGASRTTAYIKL